MRLFNTIKNDIQNLENLDLYITIALSLIIAVLNMFGGISQNVLLSAVLATLSIVATGLLVNRHQNELLKQTLESSKMAEQFLIEEQYNPSILKERILSAENLFFSGLSLARTIVVLETCLEEALRNGVTIRVLLIKPESDASRMMALRDSRMEIPSSATARINQTLTWLASIAKVSGFSDRVMVRVLDYFPAYGILAIDPDTETGYISVRLNAYQIPNERCPRFELDATKNAKWFRFFANQAELLWAEAEFINLSQYSEKTDIGEKMRGPTGKAE